jgi:antitoxin MazE
VNAIGENNVDLTPIKCVDSQSDKEYIDLCKSIREGLMHIAKWGNSLAVKLPVTLVKELGLKVGDELKLRQAVRQKGKVSELLVEKVQSKLEVLKGVRVLRTAMPKNFVFDRDDIDVR